MILAFYVIRWTLAIYWFVKYLREKDNLFKRLEYLIWVAIILNIRI